MNKEIHKNYPRWLFSMIKSMGWGPASDSMTESHFEMKWASVYIKIRNGEQLSQGETDWVKQKDKLLPNRMFIYSTLDLHVKELVEQMDVKSMDDYLKKKTNYLESKNIRLL